VILKTDKILPLVILFLSLPFLGHAQDCCGPGGGGGGGQFSSSDSDANYRLKDVRHYSYSARHFGFTVGLENSDCITPRVEYYTSLQANDRNSFNIYGALYYSVFPDEPHSHQADLCENIAWRLIASDNSRLTVRIDNETLFLFFPEDSGVKYAVFDPSIAYAYAFGFGDVSVSAGFPIDMTPETLFNSWACVGYEHPIGLGILLCPRFTMSPESSYSGTTFTLTFAWDSFYSKAALISNEDFSVISLRPYAEYTTLTNFVFWAGVDLFNIGKKEFFASPFIGVGYNF
jgi:hypothetical protein